MVLAFPNRVAVRLRNGAIESASVDVPVGSFGESGAEGELREKFLRASAEALGATAAEEAWAIGLDLESVPIDRFVAKCSPPSPPSE